MRLYIDLSPTEEANIHGWVNKGLNDPVFANHPWRIVLEEQTRARFDQIAAQFGTQPPGPPVDLELVTRDLYSSPPNVQKNVDLYVDVGYVYAIPIRLPERLGLYEWSLSEFGGEPLGHRAKLSLVAGDLANTENQNNTVPILLFDVQPDGIYKPGTIAYANVALAIGVDRGHKTHYSCIQR